MSEQRVGPPNRSVVAGAVLAGLLVVGVVVAARFAPTAPPGGQAPPPTTRTGPVALVPVEAPQAASAECAALLAALPAALPSKGAELARLPVADPAPPGAAAWGDRVAEPVVLRCGLGRPAELTPTSTLREVSGVKWLPVTGPGATMWVLVDRAVHVALTTPDTAGTGPLQTVSEVVSATLPARPPGSQPPPAPAAPTP